LIAIFKEWFINFKCFKDNNYEKKDSEFGEIPKNWDVKKLEEYVKFISGVEPGSKNYQKEKTEDNIPFIRVGDLNSRENMVYIDKNLSKNKIINPNDIIVSFDATVGIVKIGLFGAYSSGMKKLVLKNNKINKPFLYCLVKSDYIQNIINVYATGTTILHAGKSTKHMKFILPTKEYMDDFNKIGKSILYKILENLKEIDQLINLRDMLIPKLMSGEIDVSEIEI
jgi:type I restriction enzyme S subunit